MTLERRRLQADLILAFNIIKGEVDLNPSDFFLRPLRAGLRGQAYRLMQGPNRLRRRNGAFWFRVVKYWYRLRAHLVLSPSVSISKNSQWPEIFPSAPFYPHSLTIFSILLPQAIYVFPYLQSSTSVCGNYSPSRPFLPLINKIKLNVFSSH